MLRRVLPAAVLTLLLASPAFAADRLVWRHDAGHFENTAGNRWVEESPDGRTFYFREVYRGRWYIELYDFRRACRVRLTPSRCYVKFGPGPYRLYYYGYWER